MFPEKADLVFSDSKAVIEEAKALGFKNVVCCYSDAKEKPKNPAGTKSAILLSDRNNVAKLRNVFDYLIGPADREFFEDKRVDAILGPGNIPRKDSLHYRRSLTQVEAALAKQQKKTVLFNFADLLATRRQDELLGRWAQDIVVLKKKSTSFAFISGAKERFGLRSMKDLEAFWRAL